MDYLSKITFSLICSATCFAQSGEFHRSEALTFSSLPSRISGQNKYVASARALVEVARARKARITLSNPEISIALESIRQGGSRYEVELSQSFPLAGRLAREREIAFIDIAKAGLEVEQKIQDYSNEVGNLYSSLLANEAQSVFSEQIYNELQNLENDLEQRVENGQVSGDELEAFKAELYSYEADTLGIKENEDRIRMELNSRLFVEDSTRYVVVDSAEQVIKFLRSLISGGNGEFESRRPDLKSLSLNIDRAAKERELARASRWGDARFSIFGSSEDRQGEREESIGFKFSIPIPVWNFGRAAVREAEAAIKAAIEVFEGQKLSAKNEISFGARLTNRAEEKCQLIKAKVIPASERSYQGALDRFKNGAIDSRDLFIATKLRVQRESEYSKCKIDLIASLLKLKSALGLL